MNEFRPMEEPDRGNPLTAELDEVAVNHYREAAAAALDFFKDCARIVKEYRGDRGFAYDCWLMAMGWDSILGVKTQDALAKRHKKADGNPMTKASVSKLVKKFQGPAFLNLPPTNGQRKLTACQTMRQSRKQQLQ